MSIARKASASYKALPTSSKEALKSASTSEREVMTKGEIKRRSEKIGKKIKHLASWDEASTVEFF